MDNKPNVIYLHTHDAGRFIEPYGYQFKTPNLMKLAKSGVVFRKAYCVAPSCSPSRSGLLTGQYPHCNGMFGLASRNSGWKLKDYSHHICHTMKANGYETVLSGVQHLAKMPISDRDWLGYDIHLNPLPKEVHDDFDYRNIHTAAAEYIKQKHNKPFFLSIGFLDPHRSGKLFIKHKEAETSDLDWRYERPLPIYEDNDISRRESANFREGVDHIDEQMGVVLDAIKDAGIEDNTIIICTTDHGVGFPKMKCTLTDWGTGVFLIIKGPDFKKGFVSDALVSQIDIFPTLCDVLGFDMPSWLQGQSIFPILKGEADDVNEYIFTEQNFHGKWKPLRAVRDRRFKLIRNFKIGASEELFTTDGGPIYEDMMKKGLDERMVPEYQLYDMFFDPNEVNNLAYDDKYKDVFCKLNQVLTNWMQDTNDPILTDSIPKEEPDWGHKFKNVLLDNGINARI